MTFEFQKMGNLFGVKRRNSDTLLVLNKTCIDIYIKSLMKYKYIECVSSIIYEFCNHNIYATNYPTNLPELKVFNNYTTIQYKSGNLPRNEEHDLEYLDVLCSNGFKSGINYFSVKLISKSGFNFAVGIQTKLPNVLKKEYFPIKWGIDTGMCYYINSYGYAGYSDTNGKFTVDRVLKKINKNKKDFDDRILENDTIVLLLNQNKNYINYYINYKLVHTTKNVKSNNVYYPIICCAAYHSNEFFQYQLNCI